MADDITVGELSRQVANTLSRFEQLLTRLDDSYVSKNLYDLYTRGVDSALSALDKEVNEAATRRELQEKVAKGDLQPLKDKVDALDARVEKLEENITWIVRIVLTFVVVGILGAVFITAGLQK